MLCSVNVFLFDMTADLALVQWYDYKSASKPNKYNCPWVTLTSQYEFIPVESGVELVHIVPRFMKNNEYLINMFMF